MPVRASIADIEPILAFQERAYDGNRAIKGVEPLPLSVEYTGLFDYMEFWIEGPREKPEGLVILDPTHEPPGDALFIWSIATSPDQRGLGLGNKLLDFVEERARALGRKAVTLVTNNRLTERIDWYLRHDFVITRHETLTDRTVIHMRKNLVNGA
jgi:ribosomal protein S18 acetylase RimI-like enzyme